MLAKKNIILDSIPTEIDPSWIISFLNENKFSVDYIQALKSLTKINNKILANILNITPKTFTSYSKDVSKVKIVTKEHILLLLSLMKRGYEIFGDNHDFNSWLDYPNVFLDNNKPIDFLNSISGIHFIDSRLTGIAYGDNV